MFLLFLGLAGAWFGAGAEVRHLESKAAHQISSQLQGEHRRVSVRTRLGLEGVSGIIHEVTIKASKFQTPGLPLFTEPERTQSGKIRTLRLDLTDFSLGSLHMDRLSASIPDCRFDMGQAKKGQIILSKSGIGDGSVSIKAKDLEDFILHKFHEIKRVKVVLQDGRVKVSGYGEFIVIATEFSVDAKLVAEKNKLMLRDAVITFDGNTADPTSQQLLLDTLNPVVDLDADLHLFGAIDVNKIVTDKGILTATGKTQIPVRPKETH